MRIVCQTVRRITNEILGDKRLGNIPLLVFLIMHQRTCFCTERIVSNNDFLQQYFKETNSVKRRLKLFGETKINTVHLHFISLSRDFQIKIRDYFFPLFCAYFIAAVQFVISICNIIYIDTAVGWFACEETTHLQPCRTFFFARSRPRPSRGSRSFHIPLIPLPFA